ncbi:MAG: sugar ABC transporter permease, partial [Lachnospiraceae bacterium]|nr:sugar ABC transporter permease [Lachnospiraceae bacterium]
LALWLIPYIIPSVIVVQIIRLIFGKDGLLAFTKISFLDSEWAFYLLCFIFLWRNSGYIMVILLSGCSNIADEQREAAQLDGAGRKGVFWYIILPQLMPFIKFSVVMGVIGCFRLYRESYLLLGNQPCDEAYMLQNFLNNNFESWNFDRAVAASLILFVIMAIVWLILFARADREKEAAWKRY